MTTPDRYSLKATFDGSAAWFYDCFRLQQPHFLVDGLFSTDQRYIIVVPGLTMNSTALDGTPLTSWVSEKSPVGIWIEVVSERPIQARRVPIRDISSDNVFQGADLTLLEIESELIVRMCRDLRDFELKQWERDLIVVTGTSLDEATRSRVVGIVESLRLPLTGVRFVVETTRDLSKISEHPHLGLLGSRRLRGHLPGAVWLKYEEDEQFWAENRPKVLSGEFDDEFVFASDGSSRAVIDATAFTPRNIRTALTLYDRLTLAPPLAPFFEDGLKGLGIQTEELLNLVQSGHVELVFPQPLTRYAPEFLERVAELGTGRMVMPRRLQAAVMADGRRRLPLLYMASPLEARIAVLHAAAGALDDASNPIRKVLYAYVDAITDHWIRYERLALSGGPFATLTGLGGLAAKLYQAQSGHDATVELISAAVGVEWSGALNGTLFPFVSETFSQEEASFYAASVYSSRFGTATRDAAITDHIGKAEVVLDGLLTVGRDIPIPDLLQIIRQGDLARLRRAVHEVAHSAPSREVARDLVEDFNRTVRSYEQRTQRLDQLDILAGIFAIPAVAAPASQIIHWSVPLSAWLWNRFLKAVEPRLVPEYAPLGALTDAVNGLMRLSPPQAVLVSRIRRRIRNSRD